MNGENSKNLILNFDIFKDVSNIKDVHIPDYAQKFLLRLQSSINNIQEETLHKYILPNDAVPKVINELEKSLNSIMKKNMVTIKSMDYYKKIKLGELYNFAVHNNPTLKKHLNSVYMVSRVYKELYKDHPLMDNLKLRLISVRCKAIRDICLNESRRGKIRHLRCSKNPKFMPLMPRKLKSILKKINRELQKYASKDSTASSHKIDEVRRIVTRDRNISWDVVCQSLDEAVMLYYRGVEAESCRSGGGDSSLLRGLGEICQAQNKPVTDSTLLNYCEQEMAVEYLLVGSDQVVQHDMAAFDRVVECGTNGGNVGDHEDRASHQLGQYRGPCMPCGPAAVNSNSSSSSADMHAVMVPVSNYQATVADWKSSTTTARVPPVAAPSLPIATQVHHVSPLHQQDDDVDVLDFDNFQLVDVWEETKTEPVAMDGTDDLHDGHDQDALTRQTRHLGHDHNSRDTNSLERESRSTRKKRRSRFAPMTEEDLVMFQMHQVAVMSGPPGTFGFCSTFVDEDPVPGASSMVPSGVGHQDQQQVSPAVTTTVAAMATVGSTVKVEQAQQQHQMHRHDHQYMDQDQDEMSMTTRTVPLLDKGDMCKAMLRKFHDSLRVSMEGASRRPVGWDDTRRQAIEPWQTSAGASTGASASTSVGTRDKAPMAHKTNETPEAVSRHIYTTIQSKMDVLMRDHLNRGTRKAVRPGRQMPVACVSSSIVQDRQTSSPSPTPFDQTIEASMSRTRVSGGVPATAVLAVTAASSSSPGTSAASGTSHPTVPGALGSSTSTSNRRHTKSDGTHNATSAGHTSPERARLRAMMLSYKRDVEKSRVHTSSSNSTAGDMARREEGQLCLSVTNANDDCGMADLLSQVGRDHNESAHELHDNSNAVIENVELADIIGLDPDAEGAFEEDPAADLESVMAIAAKLQMQESVTAMDTDSEGLVTSSDDDIDSGVIGFSSSRKTDPTPRHQRTNVVTSTPKAGPPPPVEKNRMQWLVPAPESVSVPPMPAPATPFLDEDGQSWTGRKVFVVDSHDKGSAMAHMVKAFLQKNGARVYDMTNYKQAGKDLHVLVHQNWRFPDAASRQGTAPPQDATTAGNNNNNSSVPSSPISLLLLKNNAGVHFLSYTDLESVSRFSCQTVFPHSRSCIFLDQHALLTTHADNVRNMLDFMLTERQTSNRIWCLKISSAVYKRFCSKISENSTDTDVANLRQIQAILTEYSTKFADEDSMCLVEIQSTGSGTGDQDDMGSQQDHVLNQQYYLQNKFRHFCILTGNFNSSELDTGFLSIYGVAVLPLNTFLTNKTGKYIKNVA